MLIPTLLLLAPQVADATPTAAAATSPLRRVVVIGGSVADGVGLDDELIAHVSWKELIDAAITTRNRSIVNHADDGMNLGARQRGGKMVDAALSESPTLVVAPDFMWWFGHGERFAKEEFRLQAIGNGLALLDKFECPIIVGDIPWLPDAPKGVGRFNRPTIFASELPQPDMLGQMNALIYAWVAERPRAHLLPCAEVYAKIATKGQAQVRESSWTDMQREQLLQADFVHPTTAGALMLVLHMNDVLVRAEVVPLERFAFDVKQVEESLMEATREEREVRLERRRKQAERAQRRKEKGLDGPPGKRRRKREQGDD